MEFIYRGKVRSEKDLEIELTEKRATYSRESVAKLSHEIVDIISKTNSRDTSQNHSQAASNTLRAWLRGVERDERLYCTENRAFTMSEEAQKLECAVSYLTNQIAAYKQHATQFLNVSRDAVDHNRYTKCGWTWWR